MTGRSDSSDSPEIPPPPSAPPPGYYGPPPNAPPFASGPQSAGPSREPPRYGPPGRSNGLAIASMVLGIVSLAIAVFAFFVSWIGSVLALIFGYVANRRIAKSGGAQGGRGMAISGIVLGWIGSVLAIAIIAVVVLVAIFGDSGTGSRRTTETTFTKGTPVDVALGQPYEYDDGTTVQIYQYTDSISPGDQSQQPAPGKQFAFADVEFCAGTKYDVAYHADGFDVDMPDGHRYQAALTAETDAPATARQPSLGRGDIAPKGGCRRGWVTLEVPADQRPGSIVWDDPLFDETRWHVN